MEVMIGVDPHKEWTPRRCSIEPTRAGTDRGPRRAPSGRNLLTAWANGYGPRTWAVECAGGMGYLLSQQLVAAGETVLDVPATLASRVRVLGTGQSTKTDPNDARSVAVAAFMPRRWQRCVRLTMSRCPGCWPSGTPTWPAGEPGYYHLHALVGELVPGGIEKGGGHQPGTTTARRYGSSTMWRHSSGTARHSSSLSRSNTSTSSDRTPGTGLRGATVTA